ncbi:MAG: hypothetical protein H6832_07125 [Planctomycetes bacterium]|nr:hypothetical protein [Planctomycetota bacterium]MCB9918160.1 hypothetical protein [Planctomycetota bacterium]
MITMPLALLNANDLFVLGPLLAVVAAGFACLVPLGAFVPRILAFVGTATAFVMSLYGYTPATTKSEEFLERLGPALRDNVQFRMESVTGTLLLSAFGAFVALWMLTRPVKHARRERAESAARCFVAGASILLVVARNAFLAYVGIELLTVSCVVHAIANGDATRQRIVAAGILRRHFVASLLLLQGLALVYGGEGTLAILQIDAVNRPGLVAPRGLSIVGGTLVFAALFLRLGAVPFGRRVRRELVRTPRATRLLRIGMGQTALVLLLFAAATHIPRYLIGVVPIVALATLLVGQIATLASKDRDRLDASLATTSTGFFLIAFASQTNGQGVQDAGYAIRAGLLTLVPFVLSWLLWIGGNTLLDVHQDRDIDRFRGLGRRSPVLATLLSIAVLGLMGLPPTGAFWGRWLLLQSSWISLGPVMTAGFAFVASLGAAWSLHFIGRMWFEAPARETSSASSNAPAAQLVLAIAAILLFVTFAIPSTLLDTLVHIVL